MRTLALTILVFNVTFGAAWSVLALYATDRLGMGAVGFGFGAHAFIWGTTSVTIRQRAVPSDLQGRVGGIYTSCVYAGLVAGSLIGGTLASRCGITAPFWFAFAGSALLVVALWPHLTLIIRTDEGQPRPA